MSTPTLDQQIASLPEATPGLIRVELASALRTLRDAHNVPGALITVARAVEGSAGLLGLIASGAGKKLKGFALESQIEELAQAGVIPGEIASDLHWIRVRANKARHNSEAVELERDDAEFALSRALKILRWYLFSWGHGPKLNETASRSVVADERTSAAVTVAGHVTWASAKHFVDRVDYLVRLREALADDEVRLLVVHGRGGIGKTALVVKLLDELRKAASEPGGGVRRIVYLNLAQREHRTPDKLVRLLGEAIPAAAAQLAELWQDHAPVTDKLDRLFHEHLQRQPCFIVLDGLENVLAADGFFAPPYTDLGLFLEKLLQFEHATKVLAVSRRALSLSAEVEFEAAHHRRDLLLDEGLPVADAVTLLRTLDGDGKLRLREADDAQLSLAVQTCRGMPRTLERIVGTLRQRPTMNLAKFSTLPEGLARLAQDPARELFETLEPNERKVLQALAVFRVPVPAEAVGRALPEVDVEPVLDRFVRDYVVTFEDDRFALQPLDRDYAYQTLADSDPDSQLGRAALHRRAAEYFAGTARPPAECRTLDDLEPQLQRFRHLSSAGDYADAYSVCKEVSAKLDAWGCSSTLLQMRQSLVDTLAEPALEAQNLAYIGWVYFSQSEHAAAEESLKRALEAARAAGDFRAQASSLNTLGLVVRQREGAGRAIEIFTEAKAIALAGGQEFETARSHGHCGVALAELGRPSEAIEEYLLAEKIYAKLNKPLSVAIQHGNIGLEHYRCGRLNEAEESVRGALAVAATENAAGLESSCLSTLAGVAAQRGEFVAALETYEQAAAKIPDAGNAARRAQILCEIGQLHARCGRLDRAAQLRDDAAALIGKKQRSDPAEADLRQLEATIALLRGDAAGGLEACRAALQLNEALNAAWGSIQTRITLSRLSLLSGESTSAREMALQAKTAASESAYRPLVVAAGLAEAAATANANDSAAAESLLREALDTATECGLTAYQAETQLELGRLLLQTGRNDEAATYLHAAAASRGST